MGAEVEGEWVPVQSSNLSAVRWYASKMSALGFGFLEIVFDPKDPKGGRRGFARKYRYSGVPKSVYLGLLGAESKGKWFHRHVKGRFPYTEI